MESVPPILPKAPVAVKISKKNRRIFIFLIGAFILAALAAFAIFRKHDPVIIVQTEKVARRNITELVVASGKIQPVVEVHISPEVSGEIIALPVKEGQFVKKGDLILKINPDVYIAALNQAKAGYESSIAAKDSATASLEKAAADYKRNLELFNTKLLSESDFIGFKVARDVANAQLESAIDQVDVAKAAVDSAQDSLDKTTIVSPLDGTITKLNSQLGERVLGTVQNAGTDIMTISDLNEMEARVDIGEMDVVLIKPGQKARLEVDSFKDQKFNGIVTAIGNSAEGLDSSSAGQAYSSASSSSSSQGATQFQVRIRVTEKEFFRPGMSVTAEIETRSSTNALAVPIACVTTRVLKEKPEFASDPPKTNSVSPATNTTNVAKADGKSNEPQKPVDVVFVVNGDHVKAVPVKIGISDDNYWEITDGLHEGDEIVTGSYRAIGRDLDAGKKIRKGFAGAEAEKPQP
ncbi:MAG TPA: efflux RND transporter periplasmic adaptor subunit [Verrucomicrobiae bacterium]|jgi:HlyD family secretion protein